MKLHSSKHKSPPFNPLQLPLAAEAMSKLQEFAGSALGKFVLYIICTSIIALTIYATFKKPRYETHEGLYILDNQTGRLKIGAGEFK